VVDDSTGPGVSVHRTVQSHLFMSDWPIWGPACVLLCFIKPILGNRYGAGVSSRSEPRGHAPTNVMFIFTLFIFKTPISIGLDPYSSER